MKNNPYHDLDKLTAIEVIHVVQQFANELLAAGHAPDDLREIDSYRDLEQYVDDRLRALRDQTPQSSTIYAAMFPRESEK